MMSFMKKKVMLILIPVIILLIIGIVFIIIYFTTDLSKSSQELFWKYLSQSQDIVNIMSNDKLNMQSNFKVNNSYTSDGEISVTYKQGEGSSKQLNIVTTGRHDVNTGRSYADATLKNGDVDLFKISYINSDNIYSIMCDEVFPYYVGVRNEGLTSLVSNYGISSTIINVPDSFNKENYSGIFDFTNEQKNHISGVYVPLILEDIQESQFGESKQNIEIDGVEYGTNQYYLQITGSEAKNILLNCLNTLKTDTETLMLISTKFSQLGIGVDYSEVNNLIIRIDETVRQIQEMEFDGTIGIYVYEYKGETIRTVINILGKYYFEYTNTDNRQQLKMTLENGISSETDNLDEENNNIETNTINTNEIMESDQIQDVELEANSTTLQITITKTTSESLTTNSIEFIPDTTNLSQYLNITANINSMQSDGYSNSYIIEIGQNEEGINGLITINYVTDTVKADQVEEIQELTDSNSVIINNYDTEQFREFVEVYGNAFIETLINKLDTVGFLIYIN